MLLPAMSLLASLVLLPVISNLYGSDGWVTLGVGQSIGAVVSVVVSLAWPVIGGNLVSVAETLEARRSIFRSSIISRLIMMSILLVIAVPATILIAGRYPLETVLFMIGTAGNGLTASWYYAGIGEPRHVVVNEGIVRLVAYAISLGGLLLGGGLIWYAGVMALSGVAMLVLNWRQAMGSSKLRIPGQFAAGMRTIRSQFAGTTSRVLQAFFWFGGPTVFSLVAPGSLATFAALDQVQKASNNALGVSPMAFVSWVGSAPREDRRRRMRLSMTVILAIAVAAVVGYVVVSPFLLDFLFAGELETTPLLTVLMVLLIALLLIVRSVEFLILVPLGYEKQIYRGNTIASVIGFGLLAVGALTFGVLGGLAAWVLVTLACWCGLPSWYYEADARRDSEFGDPLRGDPPADRVVRGQNVTAKPLPPPFALGPRNGEQQILRNRAQDLSASQPGRKTALAADVNGIHHLRVAEPSMSLPATR